MQRKVTIGLLLAITMATSGCVQAVTGGPIAFEASPASVSDDALQATGYEAGEQRAFTVNQTVNVPVLGEREVRVSNHLATYSRVDAGGETGNGSETSAGAFVVLSTPQAQVAGQGTNPLGRMPLKELVQQVAARAGGNQSDVKHVGTREITVLGTETAVEKFSSTTRAEGETVETFVYVTRVAHGEDYVVGVGILPKKFEDDEDALYKLMKGIEHEGS